MKRLWMRPPATPVTRVEEGTRPNQVNQAGRLLPLLQSTLDASADATLIVDAQGRLAFANEQAKRMFSLAAFPTGSAVEPDATLGLHHPDGRPIPPQELPFARALRGEAVVDLPLLVIGPAGQRSVDCTASLLRDAQNAIVGAFATFRPRADAGRTDAAEDRLRAPLGAKSKLAEAVLENAPLAIALLAGESLLVKWANDDFRLLLGERARARDIVGLPLVEAVPGAEASGLLNLLRRGCASGRPFAQTDYEHRGLSHGLAHWRWSAVPLPGPSGEALELLFMVDDVTAQTLAGGRPTARTTPTAPTPVPVRPSVAGGQVLRTPKEGKCLPDRCAELLSQQMRAPLTSVTSLADWLHHRLAEHQLERETSASARIIECAQRLTSLAQSLAEASWLESGNDERRKVPVSLLQLIAAIAKESDAGPQRPRIRLECPDWLPPVNVNPERIERTVATLLQRAARMSPPGSPIVVRLAHRGGETVVTVVDQGPPIPHERALATFAGPGGGELDGEQADLALAMYIARLTVESHGGRIWVDGAEQRGCALSFSLPTPR